MNRNDFIFIRKDELDGHEDYWFKVTGNSEKYLTDKYMEMCMVCVTEVVYSKDEDVVGVKRLFPFNFNVIISDDEDLKNIMIDLTKTL